MLDPRFEAISTKLRDYHAAPILSERIKPLTLDDIVYVLQLVRQDQSLIDYVTTIEREIAECMGKPVIDGYADIWVKEVFPLYDDEQLEAIQGLLQHHGSEMIDLLMDIMYLEDSVAYDSDDIVSWTVHVAALKALHQAGMNVIITSGEHYRPGNGSPNVYIDLGDVVVEL